MLALPFFGNSTSVRHSSYPVIANFELQLFLKVCVLRYHLAKIFSLIDSQLGLTLFKYLFIMPILNIYLHFKHNTGLSSYRLDSLM